MKFLVQVFILRQFLGTHRQWHLETKMLISIATGALIQSLGKNPATLRGTNKEMARWCIKQCSQLRETMFVKSGLTFVSVAIEP